jgi:hypothetical protein
VDPFSVLMWLLAAVWAALFALGLGGIEALKAFAARLRRLQERGRQWWRQGRK